MSDHNDGRPAVRVEVVDNGSGIRPDQMSKIFEPFFTTKKDVGTGLGLWSAKNLVEKHAGQLLAERVEGKTRLIVLLPVPPQSASQSDAG